MSFGFRKSKSELIESFFAAGFFPPQEQILGINELFIGNDFFRGRCKETVKDVVNQRTGKRIDDKVRQIERQFDLRHFEQRRFCRIVREFCRCQNASSDGVPLSQHIDPSIAQIGTFFCVVKAFQQRIQIGTAFFAHDDVRGGAFG